jgi:hypothetical protein
MAAIALRPNWPMVRGIFTGKVRLDYARHRHPLWLNDMEKVEVFPVPVQPVPLPEEFPIIEKAENSPVIEISKGVDK